ncbi:neuropeptides capa receptor-like [Patiria miniata]|uniref:G-protein coupled receptors family 1 profile domain-containing protein n=1 Tax=Patiria miniata TaxID=46514 RepID=A0A914ARJ2_PATMI|nr:neuropeptides capa receptor-like [Patiria miniata]
MGAGITSGECSEQDTVNISQEEVSDWLYTPTDTVIITIIMPIIWCLGVTNNSTFLFVMLRVPKLRTDTVNLYLAHIALADLLYLNLACVVATLRYSASVVAFHDPFVNSAYCIGTFMAFQIVYYASIALVTMVTFERYLALCHPIKHRTIRGRRRTYRMIAICWLVGLLVAIAAMPSVAKLTVLCLNWPDDEAYLDYPSTKAYCSPIAPWVVYYLSPLFHIPWLISMVANIYMYVRILKTLNKRSDRGGLVSNDPNAIQIRNQVAKMLIVNGMVFFLCQTPYRIISLSRWICNVAKIPNPLVAGIGREYRWISAVPLYINAMINPLIYAAMTTTYRVAFKEAFRFKKQQQATSPLAITVPDQQNATRVTSVMDENTETTETRL